MKLTRLTDERLEEVKRWLKDETARDPHVGQDELASIAVELQFARGALNRVRDADSAEEAFRIAVEALSDDPVQS